MAAPTPTVRVIPWEGFGADVDHHGNGKHDIYPFGRREAADMEAERIRFACLLYIGGGRLQLTGRAGYKRVSHFSMKLVTRENRFTLR